MTREGYQPIADLIDRVRRRWRRRMWLAAAARAALAVAAVLFAAVLVARWMPSSVMALAALAVLETACVVAVLFWGLRPAGRVPSDARIARYIEERHNEVEERLVSAVHLAARGVDERPALAAPLFRDAVRSAESIDPRSVVSPEDLRRASVQAAAAVALLLVVGTVSRVPVRASFDALSMLLFPSRIVLEVTPGHARVEAGSSLTIQARLVGSTAPADAELFRSEGREDDWRAISMRADALNRFTASLNGLATSFRYKVVVGRTTSDTFEVRVARAPRVTRIEVEYVYPKALGLPPHVDNDGGDMFAPAGTDVRIRVHSDVRAVSGRMAFPDGALDLSTDHDGVLHGSLQIARDTSYRLVLADAEGLTSRGDTEYFIRTIDDRPPEVHLTRPASDRRVTPLEEVEIEADAEDDFGIASMDLVYAKRGATEQVVPLKLAARSTSVKSHHTLFLEDLDVRPGDFVSYYVRARDLARGKPSSEARSDIFFLEVKPFEGEFTMAESQAAMGGGQTGQQLDDLVAAQKQVIVATWKLDRRSRGVDGAKSEEDIRGVGRAESELQTRVEQASSAFRQSTMRDPRSRSTAGRGGSPSPGLRAGQALDEEDAMMLAAAAMGKAVSALRALRTADAVPPEMEALNQLLIAQADVKKRQIVQQATGAGGGNRSSQDLSSLFDKELARHQQTNYETPQQASGAKDDQPASQLDAIRELARRQDELLKNQEAMARGRAETTPEGATREIEKLTREQNDLRQRAEDLAQRMQQQNGDAPSSQPGKGSPTAKGADASRMRSISQEMRGAESGLRSQDPRQAAARGARALQQLRDLEHRLQAASPDARRQTLGDLQLDARQMADAERQIASESGRAGQGEAGKDVRRRLAGQQERLADRLRQAQEHLREQAESDASSAQSSPDARKLQQSASDAAREIDRQQLVDRMQQAAQAMRDGTGQPSANGSPSAPGEIARALDRLADKLATGARSVDEPSEKLSGQLARVRELRDRLDALSRQLDQLGKQDAGTDSKGRGRAGEQGQGQGGSGGASAEAERVRAEIAREMQETRALLDQINRPDDRSAQARGGRTFEGQGMTLSAPGTEGFKQDFSRWQELTRQATAALDGAETSLARQLADRDAKDRLASGADDAAPAGYQEQVDNYFKALATRKKP